MPRVSPRRLDKNIEREIVSNFNWVVSHLKSESVAKDFLGSFLTEEERLMLAKRLAVLYLLGKGFSYAKIGGVLKITPTTICSIRRISKPDKPPTKDILDLMDKRLSPKSFGL